MITQAEKVLWHIRCNYYAMPSVEHVILSPWTNAEVLAYKRSKEQWDFLHKAYFYCTQEKIFTGTFEKFILYLTKEYYPNPYQRKKRSGWWCWWSRRFNKSKYQRKVEHIPKILSEKEQSKRGWREYKKLEKDKSKRHSRSYGRKQAYVRFSNKQHRRWVKQRISHQKWDLHNNEYRFFCDPWLWD